GTPPGRWVRRPRRTSARAHAALAVTPGNFARHGCVLHAAAAAVASHGEACASLGSTCPQNCAPTTRLEPGAKAMRALAAGLGGLVGAFHWADTPRDQKALY